jgi:hypothetical protein
LKTISRKLAKYKSSVGACTIQCTILFVNVHAPTEDKCDDMKDIFYEELDRVFDQLPKYHMKILLDFNANVGRDDVFEQSIGNENLHATSNGNEVGVLKFVT